MARTKARQTKADGSTTKRTFKNVDAKSTVENEYMEMMKDIPSEAEATPMITVSDTDNDKITEIQDTDSAEALSEADNTAEKSPNDNHESEIIQDEHDGTKGGDKDADAPITTESAENVTEEVPHKIPHEAVRQLRENKENEKKTSENKSENTNHAGENDNEGTDKPKKRRPTNKEIYGYDWLGVNYDI